MTRRTQTRGDQEISVVGFLLKNLDVAADVKGVEFWGNSVAKADQFKFDRNYHFKAFEKADGRLNRFRAEEEIGQDAVWEVSQLSEVPHPIIDLNSLSNHLWEYVLVHAYTGKIINPRGEIIGFEFGDEDTEYPVNAWLNTNFHTLPEAVIEARDMLEEGDEIYLFGQVRRKTNSDEPEYIDGYGLYRID